MFELILAVIVGGIVALLFYVNHGKSRMASLVKNIPGPKSKPIIGNITDVGRGNKEFFQSLVALWKQYGSIYRLWFGNALFIFIGNPKHIEILLNSNTQIDKALVYKFMMPWIGNGLLTSTGPHWRKHRKIITPTFHFKILEEFLDIFNSTGNVLLKNLEAELNAPDFDVFPYVSLCALDAIVETAMGVKINAQENGEQEYVKAMRGMAKVIIERTIYPWLMSDYILELSETGRLQRKCLKVLHGMTKKVLEKKKVALKVNTKPENNDDKVPGAKKRLAFLDMLLESQLHDGGLTDDEIREEVETFIFEGHDTTATGVTYTLFCLAQNAKVQDSVVQELNDIFGDSNRNPTFEDLQNMKYLECAIKEALRLYPSVPMYGRKLNDDLDIGDGYILPKGSSVFVMDFMVQRDSKYYPNPEEYDPDRFLPENKRKMNTYQYVPFSAGPRNCIGQKYAMLEMKSMISRILRKFKLLPGKVGVKEIENSLSLEMVLKSLCGVKIRIETRNA